MLCKSNIIIYVQPNYYNNNVCIIAQTQTNSSMFISSTEVGILSSKHGRTSG